MSKLTKKQFKTVGDAIVAAYRAAGGRYVHRYSRYGKQVRRVKLYAVRSTRTRVNLVTLGDKYGVTIQKKILRPNRMWSYATSVVFYIEKAS